jgi:hypothetical protein
MAARLSVIVAGSREAGPPAGLMASLRPRVATGEVEVILVTTRVGVVAAEPGVRVLRCPDGATIPELRLAGLRVASAPLVALTEDFCSPVPGWADALMEARARGVADVLAGPVARQAGSAADWALTLIEYGRHFRTAPEGPVEDVPSINVAYDAACLAKALELHATGFYEVEIHARLKAQGARMWRVPEAVMVDENSKTLAEAVRGQFHHGRLYGGGRFSKRPIPSRLLHLAVTPAVPLVLLARIAPGTWAAGRGAQLVRALPALTLLLLAWTMGEATGTIAGEGGSRRRWL